MAPCVRKVLYLRAAHYFRSADNDKTTVQITTNI